MAEVQAALAFAGRHGPLLLFFGVLMGFVFPTLAAAAKPWMGLSVFVFTLGAFLKVDGEAFSAEWQHRRRAAAVLVWTMAGVPVLAWALARLLPLPSAMRMAIVLCMLGPPVGSAAAMAAMLDLNAALALTATVVISSLAPLYLPPMAALIGGPAFGLDAVSMVARTVSVVAGAGLTAFLLRRFAPQFVERNPSAMTGISVLGLLTVAIGAMHGIPQLVLGHVEQALLLLVLAFAVNAGFQLIGFALFLRLGAVDALTVGLVSGNRNVTLVWVVVTPWLGNLPLVEAYLAASVFPIFMLPLLTRPVLRRLCSGPGAAVVGSA